jgi:hypothetical protein
MSGSLSNATRCPRLRASKSAGESIEARLKEQAVPVLEMRMRPHREPNEFTSVVTTPLFIVEI